MKSEKFLADHMLKRMCKWLRMMGFDVEYPESSASDTDILRKCREENRVLMTRDHELYSRSSRSILIISEDYSKQVLQFLRNFPPDRSKYFTRCPDCNGSLNSWDGVKSNERVPDSIRESGKEIWICPRCGKTYWQGSHYDRITEQIKEFEEELK